MATHSIRHHDLGHSSLMDWALILLGVIIAWLFWPVSYH